MSKSRLVVCSGVTVPEDDPLRSGRRVVELSAHGQSNNVTIQVENVAKVFMKHLSPRLLDLLEIATYVFTADCAVLRDGMWNDEETPEPWDRDFHFIIPIRDLDFWQRSEVQRLLVDVLSFLADGSYAFTFQKLKKPQMVQEYLQFGHQTNWSFQNVDRILMFSGGLDSLAGAVQTAAHGNKFVLVSHRPNSVLSNRQSKLFQALRDQYPDRMIHIPVWINKDKNLGREHTQRTRSFLYSALGTAVAESIRAEGVRFFENGVVSLNLPVADEVLRARASRTTHPHALELFSQLYSLVTERKFVVDNPFLYKTKTDVISIIARHHAEKLIQLTCSCAHTFFQSKTQWHCGTCSQCIDRRMAILATGQGENDPKSDYVSDVFTGPWREGYEQNMAVNYVRHATELHRMSEEGIASKFNRDLARAVRFSRDRSKAAKKLVEIHKRHGIAVCAVLQQQIQEQAGSIVDGGMAETSLLAMVTGRKHLESSWRGYGDRIIGLLGTGIPVACKTHKPRNEPHLQEICDGILKSYDPALVREFPFLRWSSVSTKPDWSAESFQLWIELKYIRKKTDIHPITEAIAADITKYGDNQRRVLYIIYDPNHFLIDTRAFAEPIDKRAGMRVHFLS